MAGPGLPQQLVQVLAAGGRARPLTARWPTPGLTNREIAAQRYLSPRTVAYHLRKAFTKLRSGSRTELVRGGLPHHSPG